MDFDQARFNMIESQIRTWDVLDQAVLDAVAALRREDFVLGQYRELAFADMQIPLRSANGEPGEVMLSPKLEARMLQELALTPQDKVLEIGTGSGYFTALLARLTSSVTSVEIVPEFTERAQGRLQTAGIGNVTLEVGDGAAGWEQAAPYDAIVLTGSVPLLPDAFRVQLKPGGRLLAVIGDEPAMTATLITRVDETGYSSRGLFETCIPSLRNVVRPTRFVF
jgi:protein-L-isoaspartate(D-aspartate) O-methyltransferase